MVPSPAGRIRAVGAGWSGEQSEYGGDNGGERCTDSLVRTVPNGTTVTISCQIQGVLVDGTFGPTRWWDKIGTRRFVSDSYVNTGSDGRVAPLCDAPPGGSSTTTPTAGRAAGLTRGTSTRPSARRSSRFGSTAGCTCRSTTGTAASTSVTRTCGTTQRERSNPVNGTPAVGAVAQWNAGTWGHVAWVTRVNAGGTVTIEEYNKGGTSAYSYWTISVGSVENYIHF